jgi:AcrR family transcriptional regulator
VKASPRQERAQATYERLLDVAGALLAEVGIERISTNLICARAGVTPPALYRYFGDKYAVLAALGQRLMARQNDVLEAWIARHRGCGVAALVDHIEDLLRETAAVTRAEPGAAWTLRALTASPQLAPIRVESHRYVTDRLVEAYQAHLPEIDRETLWQRLRLAVEFGFAADVMLQEEERIPAETVFALTGQMLRGALLPAA